MLRETQKLFTIGQFADLHEINKKTLMWYDEIGLLKPIYVKENGYRYYSYQQSTQLETILMLRELNVSLDDIQEFMNHRTMGRFESLMGEQVAKLEETITHLKSVQQLLKRHQNDMRMLREQDLSKITIVEQPNRYVVAVDADSTVPLEKEIEQVIEETKKYQLHRLHNASYGTMTPISYLYEGRFLDYTGVYIEMPHATSKKGLHLQPKGKYLRAFCKGDFTQLEQTYRAILSYVEEHGIVLCGCAYEMGVNDLVIDRIEDHITQIEIPIQEKSL